MYTSYIGKKFLRLYNEREKKELTAKQFFDDVFFNVFFQDDSHLMHVGNSPFFQKTKEEDDKKHGGKSLAQLNNLRKKIASKIYSGSILVGFAAEEMDATTSGQLTSIDFKIDDEEVYASWIGEALGIGVSGGLVMLIPEDEILWNLYQGWSIYRQFLQQTPHVKDKQIETWNGCWLCHCFGKNFNPANPWEGLNIETAEALGKIAIPTTSWSKVVFAISKKYPKQILTAYAYNLSQTNTTLGFINLYLPDVRKVYELRDKLFLEKSATILNDKEIEQLETFYNFRNACKLGTIGLKALEPDKLRTYMPLGSVLYAQGKDFKFNNEQSFIDYQIYKLWIIAMINKTELLTLAADLAKILVEIENVEDRGKKIYPTLSKDVRESKNLKNFIENLISIMEKISGHGETFKNTVTQVLQMPSDNFPLFITLIRFEYQYQKSKV